MTDKIPKKLIHLLKQCGTDPQENIHGAPYILISEEQKKQIPFGNLSAAYNIKKNRINLDEMVSTMINKKRIAGTTTPNAYKLIRFYEAVGRITVDKNTFQVTDKSNLFREEDKFCFRLVENLNKIFPEIEKKITTQHTIFSLRRDHIIDIHIQISDTREICIEYDEKDHSKRKKQMGDIGARNLICNTVELRIFKEDVDEFDHFLRALCYDIIRYHDRPGQKEDRDQRTAQLIAHIIRTDEKTNIKVDMIRNIIELMNYPIIDIQLLAEHIFNADVEDVRKAIKKCIKKGTINKDGITYDDGDISGIYEKEASKLIMLYNDPQSDPYRIMYISIIHEYKKIVSGDYNTYQYRCTRETYINGLEDDAEAYRSQPMRNTRQVFKNKERKSIKDFPDSDICKSLTSIKALVDSSTKKTVKKKTKTSKKDSSDESSSDLNVSDDDNNSSDDLSEEEIDEL